MQPLGLIARDRECRLTFFMAGGKCRNLPAQGERARLLRMLLHQRRHVISYSHIVTNELINMAVYINIFDPPRSFPIWIMRILRTCLHDQRYNGCVCVPSYPSCLLVEIKKAKSCDGLDTICTLLVPMRRRLCMHVRLCLLRKLWK